jgi:hypothetical protein
MWWYYFFIKDPKFRAFSVAKFCEFGNLIKKMDGYLTGLAQDQKAKLVDPT